MKKVKYFLQLFLSISSFSLLGLENTNSSSQITKEINYTEIGRKLFNSGDFNSAFDIFDFYLIEGRHLKDNDFLEYLQMRLGRYCTSWMLNISPIIVAEDRLIRFIYSRKYIQDDLYEKFGSASFWSQALDHWKKYNNKS